MVCDLFTQKIVLVWNLPFRGSKTEERRSESRRLSKIKMTRRRRRNSSVAGGWRNWQTRRPVSAVLRMYIRDVQVQILPLQPHSARKSLQNMCAFAPTSLAMLHSCIYAFQRAHLPRRIQPPLEPPLYLLGRYLA